MSLSLRGKHICFTGALGDLTRAEIEECASEYGFVFQDTVTNATEILVVGTKPGKTKLEAAAKRGLKQWTGEEFVLMLSQDDELGIKEQPARPTEAEMNAVKNARADFYKKDPETGLFG